MMMRFYFVMIFTVFGQLQIFPQGNIIITDDNLGKSFTQQTLILEDQNLSIGINEIVNVPNDSFSQLSADNPAVQFTRARFWMKFSITNQSKDWDFILETARPITDKVLFYQVKDGKVIQALKNGDDFNYYQKSIPHRKNLFPVQIKQGETQYFYIAVISGGEGIMLPLRIHEKMTFFQQDYKDQFKNGFYFGLVCLVITIYFFFYLLLRDKTFLYYILYVFFQGLLQFSLDGYAHHHFFPASEFLVNRFPPLVGSLAILFMLVYVSVFLNLKVTARHLQKAFQVSAILIGIAIVFIFLPGKFHALSYPMVNAFSLISILLSVISIFYLRYKGVEVDNYFTLAFIVLISGAVIFILGNFGVIYNSKVSLNALKVCSILEVIILSISMSYKYRELQQDKEEAQAVALKNLKEKNAAMDEINIRLEEQVTTRTSEIEKQRSELAYKNSEILSSIKYAKRIQEAILPSDVQVSELLKDSFIFYSPKDVVSGDFYFVESKLNKTVFAAVDCTGHGVPGAFMSIVGNNYLTQAMSESTIDSPAKILQFLNKGVSDTLKQNNKGKQVRDGMDMALCMINEDRTELQFSGAKNPVYIVRNQLYKTEESIGEIREESDAHFLIEIKGDKQPIGNHSDAKLRPFSNHTVKLCAGDLVYLFTDGYADQFGGERGKKFNYKQFRHLLLKLADKSMAKQKDMMIQTFKHWIGDIEQIDDVLVMGIRV